MDSSTNMIEVCKHIDKYVSCIDSDTDNIPEISEFDMSSDMRSDNKIDSTMMNTRWNI